MSYYAGEYHKVGLRCNCHHQSDVRKKYYGNKKDTIVMTFQQKCINCGHHYWQVISTKFLNKGDINKRKISWKSDIIK